MNIINDFDTNSYTKKIKSSEKMSLDAHEDRCHSIGWNISGKYIGTCSYDCYIKVWDYKSSSSQPTSTLKMDNKIEKLCWNPVNENELSFVSKNTLCLWDIRNKKPSYNIKISEQDNINMSYNGDGKYIVVGTKGKGGDELNLVDSRKSFVLLDNYKYNDHINETSWIRSVNGVVSDYFYMAAGKSDGKIGIVKVNNNKIELIDEIYGHTSSCYCIVVSKDNKYLCVGSADSLVSIWNTKEMICKHGINAFEGSVRAIDFSCNDDYLGAAGDDHISLIDCRKGTIIGEIKCSKSDGSIYEMSFHPSENLLGYIEITKDRKTISTLHICSLKSE